MPMAPLLHSSDQQPGRIADGHSRTARHTPSVVMQALGARTAIVAPAAKLNARPTTRKVRAIPEREPPKPVSPDPSLTVPNVR